MSEEEKSSAPCDLHYHEDRREERRFRHRVGYTLVLTACTMLLSVVFLTGWQVVVQGKDLSEGILGHLLQAIGQMVGLIF